MNFSLGCDAYFSLFVCRSCSAKLFQGCCVFPSFPIAWLQQQSHAVEPPSSITEVTNENIDTAAGKTHVKSPLIWPCALNMVLQITMHWCCSNFYLQKIPHKSCNKLTEGKMCPAFIFPCGQSTVLVLEEC